MSNRITIKEIQSKKGQSPIACLTAYTSPHARILDKYVDILLVGDSLGMVLYGMESTLGVTVDIMSLHGKAVVRSSENACVVIDMPFGSYQKSKEDAFENAAKIISYSGATAVKLEGGKEMAETVSFLAERCIPVMGHIGLMPQSVNTIGGYRYQGRTKEERMKILDDALAIEAAGAFSIVLEGITESLAKEITEKLSIPTIGIGASPSCDGQVLVTEDMTGLFGEKVPKFVKIYGNTREVIENSVEQFVKEVKTRSFPTKEHCFELKPAEDKSKKLRKV